MTFTSILAAAAVISGLAGPALAQTAQVACKGYYTVGETVPAGCSQQTINASNYATWGNGAPATAAPASAPLFGTHNPLSRGMMGR